MVRELWRNIFEKNVIKKQIELLISIYHILFYLS